MKRSLLFVSLLLATSSIYASSMKGASLLNHSELAAPNVKLSFKQSKLSSQAHIKSKFNVEAESASYVHAMNTLGDVTINAQGITHIQGNDYNDLFIHNNTANYKYYKIVHEICTGPINSPAITCSGSQDTMYIEPNWFFTDGTIPAVDIALQPGQYDVSIWTTVYGIDANNKESMLADIYDVKSITVPTSANKK